MFGARGTAAERFQLPHTHVAAGLLKMPGQLSGWRLMIVSSSSLSFFGETNPTS